MSPYQKQKKQKVRKKIFRKWHRRIGFSASLFLFNLAITGILLNHYEDLELHKTYIQSDFLLDWYGIKSPENISCVKIGQENKNVSQVCQLDSLTYLITLNSQPKLLFKESAPLLSLVKNSTDIFLLTAKKLYIFSPRFELIDSLNLSESEFFNHQTDEIKAALVIDEQLLIKTQKQLLVLDESTFEFQRYTSLSPIAFRLARQVFELNNQSIRQLLNNDYRKHQITQLKFLQDLHSGQILNISGKLLTDLTGIIILLLAISGFITWQRRKNNP